MNNHSNIVVTGAAGFIGSCLVGYLNSGGYHNLILVDDFSHADKEPNLEGKKYVIKIEREIFFEWLQKEKPEIGFVYHIGARTDTTEFDYSIHEHLNVEYSKKIWMYCAQNRIPLVYASSAATYGAGELGYEDSHEIIEHLQPLNPYGVSKNEFDKWALRQAQDDNRQASNDNTSMNSTTPPAWAGLKFFNVYGPNEYHKGRMASVIFHAYNQIQNTGTVKLFKSHRPDYKDGRQLRDFIYVKDILKVCEWLLEHFKNIQGTGKARSFEDLVLATFDGAEKPVKIEYIDMPSDIRDKYQYFTEAKMEKLISSGYTNPFFSLEEGVTDYVKNYLSNNNYY